MSTRSFVRAEAYVRVLQIQTERGNGTAFTIDRDGKQWLVTARHLLPVDQPAPQCKLRSSEVSVDLAVPFLHDPGGADVAVGTLQHSITRPLELVASDDGLAISQEAFILGFPLGLKLYGGAQQFGLALVKRVGIAGFYFEGSPPLLYLDGFANNGFSGGPVVAHTDRHPTMQVVGVVSRIAGRHVPVQTKDDAGNLVDVPDAFVAENTGIIAATPIHYVTTLIDQQA